jgi:5-(carboxyamino)imidazole ribonucleotide synthase
MSAMLPAGTTIGIIGGGQLGRMLAMAAARLGYRTVVLEPQADCPAAQVCNRQIVAAYDDPAALAELAAVSAVVTYEFENVPVAAANALAASVPVRPPARALEVAQDRLVEKDLPERHRHRDSAVLARRRRCAACRSARRVRRLGRAQDPAHGV